MSYDKSKIVTVGGLKQLSVKVKSTQDSLSKCIFIDKSDDVEIVDDIGVSTQSGISTQALNVEVDNAIIDSSNDISYDGLDFDNCEYVDGGVFIKDNLVTMNLRINVTEEANKFFILNLPIPKNIMNSSAYVPVALFYAPSVYGGGYIQTNSEYNRGELIISFSDNVPIGTSIMVSAHYICE